MDEVRILEVLKTLDISESNLELCRNSFKDLRPKYHNELHCYSTSNTFYDLAQVAGLGLKEIQAGVIAAIYHDAGHLAARDDSVNIAAAMDWARKNMVLPRGVSKGLVLELISSTNTQLLERKTKVEELLHDADLLQTVKGGIMENLVWQSLLSEESREPITFRGSIAWAMDNLSTGEARDLLKEATEKVSLD